LDEENNGEKGNWMGKDTGIGP